MRFSTYNDLVAHIEDLMGSSGSELVAKEMIRIANLDWTEIDSEDIEKMFSNEQFVNLWANAEASIQA